MADVRAAEELVRLTARAVARPDDLLSDLDELIAFLVESEKQTLALIAYLKDRSRPPVAPPGGDIEFGFVLYWIHHLPWEIRLYLDLHPLLLIAYELLLSRVPPTKLTREDYEKLEAKFHKYGEPGPDGTLYGYKKYEQLDHEWMLAALNYALNVLDPCSIHPLPDNKTAPIALCRKDGADADPVLGIVGDWGTGYYPDEHGALCPAQRVMDQITDPACSPAIDYLIHLGDVYYAGTDWRPLPDEEEKNFYHLWPDQGQGRNFTLNSNHEMYGAASGYFLVTLQEGGKFAGQNGMSYFALTYGPWLVLCLDSGYYSDAYNGRKFYMDGAIGTDALDCQIQWVEQFRSHPGPIMVMTHHGGCDTLTGSVTPLYKQVLAALGRPPTLWYWGHVHNGIVYDTLNDFGAIPVITYPTRGRCCGHGAIPFGNAWGLQDREGKTDPNILYYAHTPDPALPDTSGPKPANPRVRNGYALVTLHKDGGFTEAFYETGAAKPVYQRSWAAGELDGQASDDE
jgi:hypothetical protein